MFEDLIKDDKKLNSSEESGGMKRIDIGSANTNINEVDTGGSVLLDTGTEELEQADIEATTKEINGEQVVSLGSNGEPIGDDLPEYTKINPYGPTAEKWLTESEREELQSQVDRFSEEDKEASKRVNAVIEDPDVPEITDLASAWKYACKQQGVFGLSDEDEYDSKQEAVRDQLSNRSWVESPPEERELSELTGGEFKEMLAQGMGESNHTEEEELEQEQTQETDNTIETVSEELASAASNAWQERAEKTGKEYWKSFSEELSVDIPNTSVESISQDKIRIKTTFEELAKDLVKVHKSDKWDTTLKKENDVWVAKVPKGVEV